ncbi:hypothetical protein KY345_06985 [Candidatus Woesearchaeota archaeon]|nr:hypothetical protein [Candidatus Woesearchaeota archaeon]
MKKKSKKEGKGKKVKKTLMAIAIALILVFFVGYGVNTFYEEPKWEDFCGERVGVDLYETKESCEAAGGEWTDYPERVEPVKLAPNQLICTQRPSVKGETIELSCVTAEEAEAQGWCDVNKKCNEEWENARDPHNRISFIILAIIGVIIVLIATAVLKENTVSYGTLGGGILTILYGTIRFWGAIPDIWRFTILGIVLVVLIGVAWKKLK